jgi:exodeoxyribonuclease VII large subunit
MEPQHVFSVSELNSAARTALEQTFGSVWVRGEISEMTHAPSGHLYFTLKDEGSELSAVRFKSRSSLLAQPPVDAGMSVLALGSLTVYEPRGRYQFVVSLLQPIGAGALQRAFEQLKRKLQDEGLFSAETKVALPEVPRTIGVITSPQGAALRDIHSVLQRRWPHVRLYVFASSVQGPAAPEELRAALDRAVRFSASVQPLDVLILTRGGGSAEDLAAFNEEALARAVHACPIPTVSAVGHEIDFSITDFVADCRAPTPSAAAELVVPDRREALGAVSSMVHRMKRQAYALWKERAGAHRLHSSACLMRGPQKRVETLEQRLDLGLSAMLRSIALRWKECHDAFLHGSEILRLSDPRLPLHRGYSLTFRQGETRPVTSVRSLQRGESIETHLSDGLVMSRVEEVAPHEP